MPILQNRNCLLEIFSWHIMFQESPHRTADCRSVIRWSDMVRGAGCWEIVLEDRWKSENTIITAHLTSQQVSCMRQNIFIVYEVSENKCLYSITCMQEFRFYVSSSECLIKTLFMADKIPDTLKTLLQVCQLYWL